MSSIGVQAPTESRSMAPRRGDTACYTAPQLPGYPESAIQLPERLPARGDGALCDRPAAAADAETFGV
jgi:hypothetical protein